MARVPLYTDPKYAAAVGLVVMTHARLELIQRFLIRNLENKDMVTALNSTERKHMSNVRAKVRALTQRRHFPRAVADRIDDLLKRAVDLSRERNEVVHNSPQMDRHGNLVRKRDDQTWGPAPTVAELTKLAHEINSLADEINEARLKGFISKACHAHPLT